MINNSVLNGAYRQQCGYLKANRLRIRLHVIITITIIQQFYPRQSTRTSILNRATFKYIKHID